MMRKPHNKQKKALSAEGMVSCVGKIFSSTSLPERDSRGKARQIEQRDCLMSAMAMFSLKSPSLLAFDSSRLEEPIRHNLRTLYGVRQAPCDSYMRSVLDEVDPRELRPAFLALFREIQNHKLLDRYRFINNTYLLSVDGSGVFSSDRVHCENCCEKRHKTEDGERITYHHQVLGASIVHPDCRQVIPLAPEPITKQDGVQKNDCERNAMRRFLADFKREHPRLKATIVSDALSANAPHVNHLCSLGLDYLINVKPKGNKGLFRWLEGVKLNDYCLMAGNNEYQFHYINGVPLNETANAPEVNFFECRAKEVKGRKETIRCFSWVTSHEITNENVYDLMRGARARWKVESAPQARKGVQHDDELALCA